MGKAPKALPSALEDFLERKAAAAASNSELARRAGRSLNTVKAYLRGDKVRETTVQAIHEALNAYIADQSEVTQRPSNVARIYDETRSAMDLGQNALKTCELFVQLLDAAQEKAINEGTPLDPVIEDHIRRKLRIAEALLA